MMNFIPRRFRKPITIGTFILHVYFFAIQANKAIRLIFFILTLLYFFRILDIYRTPSIALFRRPEHNPAGLPEGCLPNGPDDAGDHQRRCRHASLVRHHQPRRAGRGQRGQGQLGLLY